MHSEAPYNKLDARKVSMGLVEKIYEVTRNFPQDEKYTLTSQMRRASISIPSNIAEGASGRTSKQFSNFLAISLGSLSELDTQLELANRLGFIENPVFIQVQNHLTRAKKLVYGLKKSIDK